MTETTLNLTDNFPIWYRDVSIDADDTLRSARLEGVKQLTEEADRDLIEGLVRIAFGVNRQEPAQAALDRIHKSFKDTDPTFDVATSTREVQVLAGAALVDLFAGSNHMGDIAALSVSTASVDTARKLDLPMDLKSLADLTLNNRSVDTRERPDLREFSKTPTFKIGDGLVPKAEGEEEKPVDASHLLNLAKEMRAALRSVSTRQTDTVKALAQFIKVQDEELQVLWWFLGGRSIDLECDFDAIPTAAKPLVFGKELADETYVLPGLRTVRPLMARAGLEDKETLSIPDAINGADPNWLKRVIGEKPTSTITQPLHFAIERRLEVDDEKSWIEAWAAMTGIKAKQKLGSLALAELFYREQLLRQFT